MITANNCDVSIENCHFKNFFNENGSTILFGYNNSHVTIENSVFIQHNSSEGTLYLHNTSSIYFGGSLIAQNVATYLGFSPVSLFDRSHAAVYDTVFRNNSAIAGGAMIAIDHCSITLTNSTFSSNEAVRGKTLPFQKILQ